MLKGLRYMHGVNNIIHTNLKPENVMLTFKLPEKKGLRLTKKRARVHRSCLLITLFTPQRR